MIYKLKRFQKIQCLFICYIDVYAYVYAYLSHKTTNIDVPIHSTLRIADVQRIPYILPRTFHAKWWSYSFELLQEPRSFFYILYSLQMAYFSALLNNKKPPFRCQPPISYLLINILIFHLPEMFDLVSIIFIRMLVPSLESFLC